VDELSARIRDCAALELFPAGRRLLAEALSVRDLRALLLQGAWEHARERLAVSDASEITSNEVECIRSGIHHRLQADALCKELEQAMGSNVVLDWQHEYDRPAGQTLRALPPKRIVLIAGTLSWRAWPTRCTARRSSGGSRGSWLTSKFGRLSS
jgi:hypothetical protein